MTEKQTFIAYMTEKGFEVHNHAIGFLTQTEKKKKTDIGDHVIIKDITCTMFDGSDTKEGALGCVVFYYIGKQRNKYCRSFNDKRILNLAFCPENAQKAIKAFETWLQGTQIEIDSWENE